MVLEKKPTASGQLLAFALPPDYVPLVKLEV